MKVLFFNNCWPTESQPNVGTYAKTMADELKETGADVDVCAMQRISNNKWINYFRFYWKLLCKPLPSDTVLYVNHYIFLLPLMLRLLFIRRRCIYHWHGEELIVKGKVICFLRWLMKFTFHQEDIHISPSFYYSHVVNRVLDVPYQRILISPSGGIDLNRFSPAVYSKKSANEFVIGYSSALIKAKGADLLLQLMRNSRELQRKTSKKIIFQVIDYGADANYYISEYKKTNVELRILDKCPKEQMSDFYRSIDLFIMSSIRESLGLVVLEAMACGVPVITFDICAFPEFVISQISGERVPLSRDMNENTSEFLSVILYVMAHHAEYHPRQIALRYGKETVISFYREKLGLKSDFERKDHYCPVKVDK